jgi:hypothetical protein
MVDWRAKQRALRKYPYDAPTRPGKRGPYGDNPSVGTPVGGPGGGGLQGGASVAAPVEPSKASA